MHCVAPTDSWFFFWLSFFIPNSSLVLLLLITPQTVFQLQHHQHPLAFLFLLSPYKSIDIMRSIGYGVFSTHVLLLCMRTHFFFGFSRCSFGFIAVSFSMGSDLCVCVCVGIAKDTWLYPWSFFMVTCNVTQIFARCHFGCSTFSNEFLTIWIWARSTSLLILFFMIMYILDVLFFSLIRCKNSSLANSKS